MLSTDALKALVQRVTYKPGWTLVVRELDPVQGPQLSILVELENSYEPGTTVPLRIHSPIPPAATVEEFMEWLAWRLKLVEMHELLEWLKIDGSPWIDPHAGLDADDG